jgi:hypothetical protein
MSTAPYGLHQWPTEPQLLFLKAVLLKGDPALDAWQSWQQRNNLSDIDAGSFLVIPQLYLNLRRHDVKGATMNKLRGVYRQTWARNEIALQGLVQVTSSLQQHDISSVVIKGMPLALFCYEDPGARTMFDLDLLVAERDFPRTVDLFRQLGWSTIHGGRDVPPDNILQFFHAWSLKSPQGLSVDLHRRIVSVDLPPRYDSDSIRRAAERTFRNFRFRVPDRTDMLLVSCLNARKIEPHAACRCLVDLVTQLNHPSELAWDEVLERARDIGQILPVADALTYVHRHFDAPIPAEVLEQLQKLSPSRPETERYRRLAGAPGRIFKDSFFWARYTGLCEGLGRKRSIPEFLKVFLEAYRWKTGARGILQLLPAMIYLLADRWKRLRNS